MGQNKTTSLYPIGALTEKGEGKQLASLYEMHHQGAIGFGDYKSSLISGNLLKIALQYAQSFDGTIFSHPMNHEIAEYGMMHEGIISAKIGVKGIPTIAETIQISRDIQILSYTEGKLHIPFISSKEGLEFFEAHKSADVIHRAECEKLLDSLSKEEQIKAEKASVLTARYLWNFLSGMTSKHKLEQIAA